MGKESESRSFGFQECWLRPGRRRGVPGWDPLAETQGSLPAHQPRFEFHWGENAAGGRGRSQVGTTGGDNPGTVPGDPGSPFPSLLASQTDLVPIT